MRSAKPLFNRLWGVRHRPFLAGGEYISALIRSKAVHRTV